MIDLNGKTKFPSSLEPLLKSVREKVLYISDESDMTEEESIFLFLDAADNDIRSKV